MHNVDESGQAAHAPWYRYGVLWVGCAVLAISASVIAGWIFEPEFFRRIVSVTGATKPNTALGLLCLAVALVLLDSHRRPLRLVSRICALCAISIGVITGLEYLTHWNSGFDQILFRSAIQPVRMSPVTALNLILIGLALLLLDLHTRISPSVIFAWVTSSLSFLTLTGRAYEPDSLYPLRVFSEVGALTSITFLLLCVAIMFARPESGVAAILLRADLGGSVARRLLPAAIFIPFAVSLLIFKLYQSGTYGTALLVFLFMVAPVLTFVPLVLLSASLLSRLESERKRSEEELRVSTQRFSSVVSSAMDAIITLDESQRVIVFNAAAEKMFGCSLSEVLGKPLDRFLPVPFREIHHEHIRRFGEAGITTRSMISPGSLSALRANGEEFPIEATVSQVRVAGQKLYTVILRDVTLRKRAEETLRNSEERFRSIYEQAAVGIEQVALDGKLLMVNAALCRMLGYEERELRDKRTEDITHPDDYARELELLGAMEREHRHSYEIEKRYIHRDGSAVWVNVTSSMVSDSAGAQLYRISVIQDVTERKGVEEQLKQAQKMEAIGRLAGGVAHDFNTLLNVMLGYSDILLSELPELDPRRERVMQIKNSGDAAAMLTKQLLAFSRKQSLVREVLDLRDVVAKMTPIVTRLLRDDVEVSIKCDKLPCPVKVDPGQIQQLVLNLAANAGDAMPDGGQLTIDVRAIELDDAYVQQHPLLSVGSYAMLAISDSGAGMDSETVAHIFEPFFTTKDAGKGTGLGLATVYGIVKGNGGDIWVYSEPGVGTIFKIYLPLTTEVLEQPEPAAVQTRPGGGENILLVEDSPALRELTRVILTREGYHVLEAEDGIAALQVSRECPEKIHLLLTDVVMPRMRGPQVAAKISKERPGIAIVFLSGYTEEAICHSDGIAGFTLVEKPYTADALLRSIRRALDDSASRAVIGVQSTSARPAR